MTEEEERALKRKEINRQNYERNKEEIKRKQKERYDAAHKVVPEQDPHKNIKDIATVVVINDILNNIKDSEKKIDTEPETKSITENSFEQKQKAAQEKNKDLLEDEDLPLVDAVDHPDYETHKDAKSKYTFRKFLRTVIKLNPNFDEWVYKPITKDNDIDEIRNGIRQVRDTAGAAAGVAISASAAGVIPAAAGTVLGAVAGGAALTDKVLGVYEKYYY